MSAPPFVLMIAGPNGSGKTTLTNELRQRGVDFGVYINADDIAADLSGSYMARVRAAQAEADARRERCLEAGTDFSFETVMSHPSKVELLRRARARGFTTVLYFVSTEEPALNVARVRQRVALGGHDVPEDRIIARYHRTMSLLPAAVDVSDQVVLFDNTTRAARGKPVVLRPFLMHRRIPPEVMHLEEPIPVWGREIVKVVRGWGQAGR